MINGQTESEFMYMLPMSSGGTPGARAETKMWRDEDGPSFGEILDILNPLQHLPIISTIYRAITSDEISLGSRLAGGAIFGGGLGFVITGLTAAMEEAAGTDMGEQVAALFSAPDANAAAVAESGATAVPAPAAAPATAPSQMAAVGPPIDLRPKPALFEPETGQGGRAAVRAQLEAQHAQAQMLLSRLATGAGDRTADAPQAARNSPAPAARHPLMPPPDATAEWYLRAMDRAFEKYRGQPAGQDAPPDGRTAAGDTAKTAFASSGGAI